MVQDNVTSGRLFVLSGPSGSGKSTLCRMAIARTSACLSVSATTRPRGDSEIDGQDYYFFSPEVFEEKIKANEFLEYAEVFGNYYGTPAATVNKMLRRGQTVVLEIDVQGAVQVFENMPEAMGIFILPPSMEELKLRLQRRGREGQDVIQKRLKKAEWEIEQARANANYKYFITNMQLDEAAEELIEILS